MERIKTASRPISSRPLTNTGLIAPKSSRGKTGLRRQIQDKSYFIGLLRMKINEINAENNSLIRECEIMAKEEARIGVYKQKAEAFARELNDLTLDLSVYNEFLDRARIDEEMTMVKEDTNEIKHENEALMANLENDYAKLRDLENTMKMNEGKLKEVQKLINTVKNKLNESQISEFNMIQSMNNELSRECQLLEQEIGIWRAKKNEIEDKTVREDNLLNMELIKAISKLRNLEKQKNKLLNSDDTEENERKHLLAQVKRDNNYINSIMNKIDQLKIDLTNIENEIDFYKDGDKMKYSDLKQQDKIFDEFINKYTTQKETLINELETINHEINDTAQKLSRCLKYLNMCKNFQTAKSRIYDDDIEDLIHKKNLELEIYKSSQLLEKAISEKDALNLKISKFKDGINSYSDITTMKQQVEMKLANVKEKHNNYKQLITKLKLEKENMTSEIREIQFQLEKDPNHQLIIQYENELGEILRVNAQLQENDNSQMLTEMKATILDNVKKYNQSLIGF